MLPMEANHILKLHCGHDFLYLLCLGSVDPQSLMVSLTTIVESVELRHHSSLQVCQLLLLRAELDDHASASN